MTSAANFLLIQVITLLPDWLTDVTRGLRLISNTAHRAFISDRRGRQQCASFHHVTTSPSFCRRKASSGRQSSPCLSGLPAPCRSVRNQPFHCSVHRLLSPLVNVTAANLFNQSGTGNISPYLMF